MSKNIAETKAIEACKKNWKKYAGCNCKAKEIPEGKGYDLECKHKHIEVKGTSEKSPGFRYMTDGSFKAAQKDPLFELWVITDVNKSPTFHIIKAMELLSIVKMEVQWKIPLGKARLSHYKAD